MSLTAPGHPLRRIIAPALVATLALSTAVPAAATATTATTSAVTTSAVTNGVLTDDFSGLGDDWYVASGTWRAEDGHAVADEQPGDRGYSLALVGHRLDGDGRVTVDVSTSAGNDSSWVGVHVHRDAVLDDYTMSGYTALLRRSGELVIIGAAGNSGVDYLARADTTARTGDGPVRIEVEIVGDELRAAVGGTTVTVTDSSFRGGGVSLVAHRGTAAAFDDVQAEGVVPSDDTIPPAPGCTVRDDASVGDARGPVLVDDDRVDVVSARIAAGTEPQVSAWDQLQEALAADLAREPDAPEVFFVPWFYNDPDVHRAARDGLQHDANAAYRLALAYRITGDVTYGEHAVEFLDAWTDVPCFRTSEDSALAFSYHFPAMIYAASLLRDQPVWPAADEAEFAAMIGTEALRVGKSIDGGMNNWGSWALALESAIGGYLDDDALLAEVAASARAKLDHQIAADGHLVEEVGRNGGVGDYGIWYSHFSLAPTVLTAEVLDAHGLDLYGYENSQGATIEDATALLADWVDDPATFSHYDGDLDGLHNVRTIDYLADQGVTAHSMAWFEIAATRFDLPVVDGLLAEERPMTAIHSAPVLTLTHGDLVHDATVVPAWGAATVYTEGDRVSFDGTLWEATWWTSAQEPGTSPYGPWQEVASISDGTPAWTASRIFTEGVVVIHHDERYEAKWWTRNQEPGAPYGPWRALD
ncbi:alginate lyase family protein [Isoptericola halotolerans]|uniref:alginate lyase family protein n=1 Tax=Isoptericola halotolerans TaxID=300560 RepID=UPI00388DBA46